MIDQFLHATTSPCPQCHRAMAAALWRANVQSCACHTRYRNRGARCTKDPELPLVTLGRGRRT
jgi:hypothetical protein